jgi:hypothetical protein
MRAPEASGDVPAIWLERFNAAADKDWLTELTLAGAEAMHQIDGATSVWRMTAAEAESVRALPQVANVGLFHPAYVPTLDIVGREEPLDAAGLAGLQLAIPPATPEGNLELRVFDALDPASVRPAIEQAGATVITELSHGF